MAVWFPRRSAVGDAIRARAVAGLDGDDDDAWPAVDAGDAATAWWAAGADDDRSVNRRVSRALGQLMLSPEPSVVVTTHSNFVRRLFRAEGAMVSRAFASRKLQNCGVLAVRVEFDAPAGARFAEARLLFGSGFVGDTAADGRGALNEAIIRNKRGGEAASASPANAADS